MKLDLPSDRELMVWCRRTGLHIACGVRPALELYRARRRLAGRGERVGVVNQGRITDLHMTETAVRRKVRFRYSQVTPVRDVALVVDLSRVDDTPDTNRLLSVATVAGGVALGMPATRVTVLAVGTRAFVHPWQVSGLGALGLLRQVMTGFGHLPRAEPPAAGHLRRACYFCPTAHVMFVTHELPVQAFDRLALPAGGTLFLVSPGNSRWRNLFGAGRATDIFGDADSAKDGYTVRCLNMVAPLRPKRIQVLRVEPRTEIREAMTTAIDRTGGI